MVLLVGRFNHRKFATVAASFSLLQKFSSLILTENSKEFYNFLGHYAAASFFFNFNQPYLQLIRVNCGEFMDTVHPSKFIDIFFTFLIKKRRGNIHFVNECHILPQRSISHLGANNTPTVSPDLVEFRFDFTAQRNGRKKDRKMRYFLDIITYSNLCHDRIFKECRPFFSCLSISPPKHGILFFFPSFHLFLCVLKFILTEIFFLSVYQKPIFLFVPKVQHHSICSSRFFYCVMEFAFSLNHFYHI